MLEYIDRRGSDCYKWDSEQAKGTLPLWVADMDFAAAKPIREAMQRRLEHGVFGYSIVPQAHYDAVAHWFERRHGWKGINRDNLLYTTAVVPAISAVLKALELLRTSDCQPLRVLTFTPAYNCFFSCIENMECELVPSPLVLQNNRFEINWTDLETKAKKADVFLLCNPHNPTGRVWSREELERMADIMRREHLFVLSDEIHCEFVYPGYKYVPFASISEELQHHSITCNAPSKAFNTAGLQIANIISDNPDYRQKIDRAININEVCDVNPFGVIALQAAYTKEGKEWLRQLNEYLFNNYNYLKEYFEKEIPQFPITKLEGTYLAWVDCSVVLDKRADGVSLSHCGLDAPLPSFEDYLLKHHQVLVNDGSMYGDNRFIRINLACPRQRLEEGLKRIVAGLQELL